MTLPIIQSCWIGDDLTNLEKLCVQSFLDYGHEFHLYTYTNIGGIPARATVRDGNEILSADKIFRTKNGNIGAFSDWFRYELLLKRGGWWVDMDCVCLKPFSFDSDVVFASRGGAVVCGMMLCPPNHDIVAALAHACRHHTADQPWDTEKDRKTKATARRKNQTKPEIPYGALGPSLLDKAVRYFGLLEYAKPYMYFLPIGSEHWYYIFDDSFADGIDFPENTYCVHVWNSLVSRQSFGKNAVFSEKSLFEQLKAKHGIVNDPNAPEITAEQIHAIHSSEKQNAAQKRKSRIKRERILFVLTALLAGIGIGLLL